MLAGGLAGLLLVGTTWDVPWWIAEVWLVELQGQRIDDRYLIGAVLGEGADAVVHYAMDRHLRRTVAIKLLRPELCIDPTFVARFEREARAAAQLHHPAVVSVHDQGVDGDQVYLVMELIDGGNLRDLLNQRGKLAPAIALSVLGPVLSALGAAHRAGLVHRDVKPENVLIGPGGQVKVADFGLARAIAENGVTRSVRVRPTVGIAIRRSSSAPMKPSSTNPDSAAYMAASRPR